MASGCKCGGCGIAADDWFESAGEELPEWLGVNSVWYCSEACYEEGTDITAEAVGVNCE